MSDQEHRPNWAAKITGTIDQADVNEVARLKLENAALARRIKELESELVRLSHEYN